jgi:hypothetical protein
MFTQRNLLARARGSVAKPFLPSASRTCIRKDAPSPAINRWAIFVRPLRGLNLQRDPVDINRPLHPSVILLRKFFKARNCNCFTAPSLRSSSFAISRMLFSSAKRIKTTRR